MIPGKYATAVLMKSDTLEMLSIIITDRPTQDKRYFKHVCKHVLSPPYLFSKGGTVAGSQDPLIHNFTFYLANRTLCNEIFLLKAEQQRSVINAHHAVRTGECISEKTELLNSLFSLASLIQIPLTG